MNTNFIPGMEEFFFDEDNEEEFFFDNISPGKRFFDAASLPDVPTKQHNANNSQTYVLHIAFPSQEELKRAIIALTAGKRKTLAANAKEGTINGIAVRDDGLNLLEFWENILLPKTDSNSDNIEDEAKEPI